MKMKWDWEEKRQITSHINGSVWSQKNPQTQNTKYKEMDKKKTVQIGGQTRGSSRRDQATQAPMK